ncbi:translocation/assembly module TamB domain-containing protein [Candidatus Ruminimicrobiellum ovillum]|uniref:translocation/assembly module TamB domain-containing protein n=1 Tax=Candidatus Ruminimicrobiellum ovillum TaxID=1947927 RepID=UPI00355AA29E
MWKTIRYVLYFTVLILVFSVTYKFREYYYVPYIQKAISKVDSRIKFRNFSIKLPFGLMLHDVEFDNKIFIDNAELRFEPDIFFQNIKSPLKSLSSLKIDKLSYINEKKEIELPSEQEQPKTAFEKIKINLLTKIISSFNVNCEINKINILIKNKLIKIQKMSFTLNKEMDIGGEIFYSKHKIHTRGNLKLDGNFVTSDFYTETDGLIKSKFDLFGNYNLYDGCFEYDIDMKDLFVNRLELGTLTTSIKKDTSTFTVCSEGENVNAYFKSENLPFKVWNSTGTLTIRDINDVINTKLNYIAGYNNKKLDLKINATDLTIFGNNFGNLTFNANNNDDILKAHCYHTSGNSFESVIKDDGSYHTDVYNNKKKFGYMSGNYKRGEISVDIKNIPIKQLPFIEKFKNVKGSLSLYGNIYSDKGTIYLTGKQIASKKLKNFDISGKLYKQDYKWFSEISTKDKKIDMTAFYETKKNNELIINYNGVDSNNVLQILGLKDPQLSGKVTGTIKYSTNDNATSVNMNLKKGELFGNKFNIWNIAGHYSNKQVNISTFSFNGPQTKIDTKAFIDFADKTSDSFFNTSIKNFKFKGININYDLTINGKLVEDNKIIGRISADKFEVGKINLAHKAFMELSTEKLNLKHFNNGNGLSGNFEYVFSTGNISSVIKHTQSKLSKYYSNIKGRLTSEIRTSGDINNPTVLVNANIDNGLYNDLSFDFNTNISYRNNKMNLNKFTVNAGDKEKAKITGSGVLDAINSNLQIEFKNVSENIINRYFGFRTPLKGTFYGNGTVTGKIRNLKYALNLYADTMFVKSLKFNSFVSKLTAQNKIISIEDAKVKISDSEMKILSANFDANTMKYNSELKFVNTHLGPFDVFGNVKIDGKMTRKKQSYMYKGNINFINLWLNDERVDSLLLNYTVLDRNFEFKTDNGNILKMSGKVLFDNYPKVAFKDVLFNYGKQYYNLNGFILSDNIDINMTGKKLDLSELTDLFALPVNLTGAVDFNLKTKGKIADPTINLTINSSNGSVYNVPFDLCDIAIDVKNNNLNIDKFNIKKSGKYNVVIDGFFPFWLDSKLKKQLMNKEVNVNYKLNDDSLYILKNLANNTITAKKGNLKIDGNLTGIRKNISNVGKMTMTGTNIKTESYVSKIKDLDIDIVWDNNLFTIQTAKAKAGSGTVEAKGSVKLQGINPVVYDLSLFSSKKGVPVVVKQLPIPTSGVLKMESSGFANYTKGVPIFDFKLKGTPADLKLTGWAELESTNLCFPPPVKSNTEIPDFIAELFKNLYIDIDLKNGTDTNFENSVLNVALKGLVNLKGPIDEISANGVATSDRGLFSIIGNDFDVVSAKIEIINNDVFITAEGEAEVYTAGDSAAEVFKVYIDRSNIKDIKTRFASKNDPTMDSKKALSRLTKTDPSQTTALDTSTDFLVKQQAIRLFSSSVATPLANTVLKKTGLIDNVRLGFINQDTLQIDPDEQATMAELLYGMKYSVEKNVNRLLQIGYSVTFDKVQREIDLKQALEMSFKLNRNLFLKGSYGLHSDNPNYEPEKKFMIEQRLRF